MTFFNLIIFASHFIPNQSVTKDYSIIHANYLDIIAKVSRIFGCFISLHLMRSVGEVNTMAFGSLIGTPFILSNLTWHLKELNVEDPSQPEEKFIYEEWFINFATVIFYVCNGISEGITVPALLKYNADASPLCMKGFLFGFNWGFYHLAHIIGTLAGYLFFGHLSIFEYLPYLWILTLFGSFLFFLATPNS